MFAGALGWLLLVGLAVGEPETDSCRDAGCEEDAAPLLQTAARHSTQYARETVGHVAAVGVRGGESFENVLERVEKNVGQKKGCLIKSLEALGDTGMSKKNDLSFMADQFDALAKGDDPVAAASNLIFAGASLMSGIPGPVGVGMQVIALVSSLLAEIFGWGGDSSTTPALSIDQIRRAVKDELEAYATDEMVRDIKTTTEYTMDLAATIKDMFLTKGQNYNRHLNSKGARREFRKHLQRVTGGLNNGLKYKYISLKNLMDDNMAAYINTKWENDGFRCFFQPLATCTEEGDCIDTRTQKSRGSCY
eukprot:TRINITY_DN45405_c0_g1_i1.p1 TRINITY_DN45405_c0_g1~~TRINITY_DN45405_c0_g1_i1.p1  ORF type:complete len:306 (+),score=32.12 TRINITY_DN45405_c0_g1_i1:80-997(+)